LPSTLPLLYPLGLARGDWLFRHAVAATDAV
jgi:hypothetical protein